MFCDRCDWHRCSSGAFSVTDLGVIGECMLELRNSADQYKMGFGGDVFNTAVYAVREGLEVTFFSAVGDDHYSNYLLDCWQRERVSTATVRVIPSATPSLYIINTDDQGERSFYYWRDASPFKSWLAPGQYVDKLGDELQRCQCVYFSGITLALLSPEQRLLLFGLLKDIRANGRLVAFDPNYRPRLWQSAGDAMHWFDQAYALSDIAFPSIDDEVLLRGEQSSESIIDRLVNLGLREIVLKNGASGSTVVTPEQTIKIPATHVETVVDTTAAGDSFNGAYFSVRLKGGRVIDAAEAGCKLAAQVIQHSGAIVPTSPA
jgi:2-dehydro-3-deoxygluconokinase